MAMFLKPNPNKIVNDLPMQVYDPQRKGWLPAEGAAVPNDTYWVRRLADGDCVEMSAVAAAPESVAETAEPVEVKKTNSKKGK